MPRTAPRPVSKVLVATLLGSGCALIAVDPLSDLLLTPCGIAVGALGCALGAARWVSRELEMHRAELRDERQEQQERRAHDRAEQEHRLLAAFEKEREQLLADVENKRAEIAAEAFGLGLQAAYGTSVQRRPDHATVHPLPGRRTTAPPLPPDDEIVPSI